MEQIDLQNLILAYCNNNETLAAAFIAGAVDCLLELSNKLEKNYQEEHADDATWESGYCSGLSFVHDIIHNTSNDTIF